MTGSGELAPKGRPAAGRSRLCSPWRGDAASQLLEFALALPMLAVLLVGAADFGAAWALKDKLTNAAREGARLGAGQPDDLSQGSPPASVTAVRNAVANYLTNAQVTTCVVGTSATAGGYGKWTYSSSTTGCSNFSLVIERAYTFTGGSTVQATRVTLNHPFSWKFAQVIKLLVPSSSYANPFTITTAVVMQNLS